MDDSNGRFFDGLKDSSVSQLSIGDTTDFSSRNVNVHKDRLSGSEIVDNIADTQASEDLHTIHTNHTTNFNTEFGKESLLESGEDTEGETEGSEEDEEDDDDDDDESEEEEEDNEPPMLKYTRITKLPRNFFQRDSISSCLFHDKVFAFATHSGILHLTRPDFSPIRTFKCHRSSILSIYTDGEYFASASIDGTVVIGSIEDAADIIAFDFKRPVHAVVLDQSYKSTKIFISGGMAGEVIVSQRNWMGTRVDSRVDKEHGPIVGIYTLDDIIFWMNDNGITFYSIPAKTKLLHIPFADGDSIRPDLYWPKVHFPEVNSIIVCWGMNVWSFKVSLTNSVEKQLKLGSILSTAASSLRAVPDKKVELENHFKLDCLIAGIASFKDDQLLVLGLNPSGSRMNPPELKVVDMVSGEELHNDEVVSKNFQNMTLNDYHLGKYIGSNNPEYFLISANDAILVREFSLNDRYKWYVENKFFFRAWEISKFVADELDRFDTGLKYVDQLISEKKWHQAAKILCVVSKDISWDVDSDSESKKTALNRWQDMILKFLQEGQVDTIVPYIPTNPRMQPVVYDRVLKSYLAKQEYTNFSNYLKQWPIYTYSADDIEELLEEKHQSGKDDANDNYYLSNSLCYLYLQQRKFLLAISHLIKLHDPQALDILISENILATFVDQLVDIILLPYSGPINELGMLPLNKVEEVFAKSIKLLVQNRNSIPLSRVVDILSSDLQIILFLYFKNLSAIEPHMVVPYETKMVELYSKYEPKQLLTFLKKHSNYNIERSIEICEREDSHHQELIYLLGKIGETKKALSLIIDKLDDPALAIAFVIDSNDSELWHFMVSYSLDKPNFIKSLLQHRDEFGEKTLEVMKRIPEDAEIDEEMKIILRNITKANWLSKRVNLGVLKIIDDETKEVALEFLKIRRKGKLFNNED